MNRELKKVKFALQSIGIVIFLLLCTGCSSKSESRQNVEENGLTPKTENVSGQTRVVSASKGFYRIEDNKKFGIISDRNGSRKIIVPAEYDEIIWRNWKTGSDLYFIGNKNGLFSLFSEKGDKLLSDYEAISFENNGRNFIRIKVNGKYGVLSPDLQTILPPEYDSLSNWVNVLAHGMGFGFENTGHMVVYQNKKLGIVRLSDGKFVVPIKFIDINYHNGVFIVEDDKTRFGAYSLSGQELMPVCYQALSNWDENVFVVCENDKCRIEDRKTQKKTEIGGANKRLHVYGSYLLTNGTIFGKDGKKLYDDVDDASEFTVYDSQKNPVSASRDTIAIASHGQTYLICGSQKWPVKDFYTGVEGAEFWTSGSKALSEEEALDYCRKEGIHTLEYDEAFNLGEFKNAFDYK